jgi:hypothetical protein
MADLSLTPDYSFEVSHEFKTITSPFENGDEERRAKWEEELKTWHLVYVKRTLAEFEIVKALFQASFGAAYPFTWLHPDEGVEYTVHFSEDKLKVIKTQYGRYDFEFNLKEER